ncbi:MAG: hypothetical protein WB615_06630 [Candidatus Tumulicola sp.]
MTSRPTIAIVVSIVWGVLLIPGLVGAALSSMFFDAPGSMNNPAAWINAGIVVSFLLLCFVAIAGSWVAWAVRRNRAASKASAVAQIAVASLPLLPIAYVAVAMAIEMIGVLASGQPMGLHSTVISH